MRIALIAAALVLTACGQPAPNGEGSSSPISPNIPVMPLVVESEALVGAWSFDHTCASGDGMRLGADGTAGFDEWGQGTWAIAQPDNRVSLDLAVSEPGMGPTGARATVRITVTMPVTDDLIGELTSSEAAEPRPINALRCPE